MIVICAGLTDYYEVEGLDRQHMHLPLGHDALIKELVQVHDKIVIVLSNGSPVEMPWIHDVSAVLEGYLAGQAGASAIADILVGETNPSGKLAETFPIQLEDNPSYHYFPMGPQQVEYRESIYVGYRYYDSVDQEVLFPFGHGLSYTSFEYSDLQLSRSTITGQESLTVSLKVANTGTVAGKEIVQVYVHAVHPTVFRPEKELKGFAKVELQPGEETEIVIDLDRRAFSYYNTKINGWVAEPGTYEILVGASSRDIRLNTALEVTGAQTPAPQADRDRLHAYYDFPKDSPVRREDFSALLGRTLSEKMTPIPGDYTLNTPIGDMSASLVGRLLQRFIASQIRKLIAGQEGTPTAYLMEAMVSDMPLRSIVMMSSGLVTRQVADAVLVMINGHFFKGLYLFIRAIL
jgi:beta-glucosidase